MRREALCFRENLLIFEKTKTDVDEKKKSILGTYLIAIEKIGHQGHDFLINSILTMKLNGFHCGSKIIGSVTEKLQCLEEKRNE